MTRTARTRAKYRAAGCCHYCPQPVTPGHSMCQKHLDYNATRRLAAYHAAKEQVSGPVGEGEHASPAP